MHDRAVFAWLDDKAVAIGSGLERGEAAEEQRLRLVGAAVLGAEHVAMPAFVASVGEGGELPRLCDRERADALDRPSPVLRRQPLDRRLAHRDQKLKLASFGHTGMHLSQVRQSNRTSALPIFFGGVAFSAAL